MILQNQTFIHFSKRLEPNALWLATQTRGAFLTGVHKGAILDELASSQPLFFQDEGTDDGPQGSLLTPDESWRLAQEYASVYTSRVVYVDEVSDVSFAEATLKSAVERTTQSAKEIRKGADGTVVLSLFGLHHHWASQNGKLIAKQLLDLEGPVGLMFWHSQDPFQTAKAIEGVLDLIQVRPEVGVIRSDQATLGFQSHGALFGSIGIGTGTRHFTRPTDRGYADLSDRSPRLWIPSLGTFWKATRVANAGDHELLTCSCSVCGGLPLSRFTHKEMKQEAAKHSVASWSEFSRKMRGTLPQKRQEWWRQQIESFRDNLTELEEARYLPEPPSRQLIAWCDVLGLSRP